MPNPELERLERLDHAQRIRHWTSAKPWAGLRLPPIQKPFLAHRVKVDRGNITAMPLLVGRPCFGQPTAIMRHGGGARQWSPRSRSWVPDRCARCAVSEACKYVAAERLRATPEIDDYYREWVHLGGREATWLNEGPPGTVALVYTKLIRLLTTQVEFTSVNDALVAAHYDGLEEKRRTQEAERKRKERAKKSEERAREGKFDEIVLEELSGQMAWRYVAHRSAQAHPQGPSQIKRAKTASLFDARTWLAKTRLELRSISTNDSNISRELQAIGFEQHRPHGALRHAVRRALSRIDLLERTRLPGESSVIWPRFSMRELRHHLASHPLQSLR
ncbi:hypothetical protein V6R86_10750 [Sphingomonas kaistensis]|uniref:Uncharacterized protein n=1 Tax=Sphingomonas kaistensis TaxID=298708 RepID=A0ABZ2G220_9SPHN